MHARSPIVKLDDGLYQVRVPLPFPLRWVNAYVLHSESGCSIIDPGLHTEQALQCWEEALRFIGISFTDVTDIILTHHHPDHIGLAGTLQQRSGAPVYLSAAGIAQTMYLWGPARDATEEIAALFVRHGVDKSTELAMLEHLESFIPLVTPLPIFTPMTEGDRIAVGGRGLRAIHGPGHAYGQFMLLDEHRGDLFCGDQVLPKITPNVSLLPRFDDNPLESFLSSLTQISQLPVARVLPGHRDPFTGLAERCEQIIQHHEERLRGIWQLLEQPATGFEVCRLLFGDSLSIHQLRFALAETLAHLVYLRERGQLQETIGTLNGRDVFVYSHSS